MRKRRTPTVYTNARQFLGTTLTVTIDRPLGSVHPRHDDIYYPVTMASFPERSRPTAPSLMSTCWASSRRSRRLQGRALASSSVPTTMTTNS